MISALRQFLGPNDMLAYLVMMAARLVELHRVLKPTGSLYLHCDPTAHTSPSHPSNWWGISVAEG
jgi:site-specific DNA-methyltransferase (adenine-specific)